MSRSTTMSQSRSSDSSSTAPTSWSTDCASIELEVDAASWSSVDTASRNEPRARARDERERGVLRLDALAVGDAPEQRDEVGQPRPLEDERLAARAHGREHLLQLGRAEDEDEVGRRLLDELQERLPRGIGELVRLVEDVDLVAALDRLEDDALADLADVVDPALRGGVHLDDVERGAVRDREADGHVLSGVGDGPGVPAQFSAFARIRAIEVFPVPRGPAKRYAWRTWSCSIAFCSVRTTASCPTTSSNPCGRYFR